jgi:hypothetical protein
VKNSSEPEAKAIQKEIDDYIFVKTDGKNNFEKSM